MRIIRTILPFRTRLTLNMERTWIWITNSRLSVKINHKVHPDIPSSIPHIFVWGSCFWFCIPLPPAPTGPAASTHNFVTHPLSHTTFTHTIFHTQLCHTVSFTRKFVTHHLSHTTLSHTTLSHSIFHTQLCHTHHFLKTTLRGRRGTSWPPPSFHVASVALGDIYLRFTWQAWRLATSTFFSRFRRGTYDTGPALVARLGAAWARLTPRHFAWHAWQAWHLATSTVALRGRRGTYGTGLALVACMGAAWAPLIARWRRGTLHGRRCSTWRHPPSLRAAGVALGDIHVHCAWQAWRLRHWAGSGGAFGRRLGRRGTWRHPPSLCVSGVALHDIHLHFAWHACDIHIRFAWQATFVLRCRHPHSLCVAGVALAGMALGDIHLRLAFGVAGVALGDIHLPGRHGTWQAWHLVTSTSEVAWQLWHLLTSTYVLYVLLLCQRCLRVLQPCLAMFFLHTVFGCISYFVTWLSMYGLVALAQRRKRPCVHLIDTLCKRCWPVSARLRNT